MPGRVLLIRIASVVASAVQPDKALDDGCRTFHTLNFDGRLDLQLHAAIERFCFSKLHAARIFEPTRTGVMKRTRSSP